MGGPLKFDLVPSSYWARLACLSKMRVANDGAACVGKKFSGLGNNLPETGNFFRRYIVPAHYATGFNRKRATIRGLSTFWT